MSNLRMQMKNKVLVILSVMIVIDTILAAALNAEEKGQRNKGREYLEEMDNKPEKMIKQVNLPVRKREKKEKEDKVLPNGKLLKVNNMPGKVKEKFKGKGDNLGFRINNHSKNGKYLAVTGYDDGHAKNIVYDRETEEIVFEDKWDDYREYLYKRYRVSKNRKVAIEWGGNLSFYDGEGKKKKEYEIKTKSWRALSTFDINGESLLALGSNDDMSYWTLYDYDGNIKWEKQFDGYISNSSLIFSKNQKYFAFGVTTDEGKNRKTIVMDVEGNVIQEISTGRKGINSIENGSVSDDGKRMAVLDGTVKYYDIENNQLLWMGIGNPLPRTQIEEKHIDSEGNETVIYKYYGGGKVRNVDITRSGMYVLALSVQQRAQDKYGPWYITVANKYHETIFENEYDMNIEKASFSADGMTIIVVTEDEVIELDCSEYLK